MIEDAGGRRPLPPEPVREATVLQAPDLATQHWVAWLALRNDAPHTLHVEGEACLPNMGVDAFLMPTAPQSPDPDLLLLDVVLVQRPGIWPRVEQWKPVRYTRRVLETESAQGRVALRVGSREVAVVTVRHFPIVPPPHD